MPKPYSITFSPIFRPALDQFFASPKCSLNWRDAQHLVSRSVRPRSELSGGAGWGRNAAGRWYSKTFGFGLVDAGALVENARYCDLPH